MIKGVIFPNQVAHDGKQGAVYNFYKDKVPSTKVSRYSRGVKNSLDAEVLMILDPKVLDFPFNPEIIVDIDPSTSKFFAIDG